MNQTELKQFAQQLVLWSELIIENGRTPFRRVDLYPEIHTDQGPLKPPLVFWINRQSMMAGGILFLPKNNLELDWEQGRSCCAALGLKHFITWETDRVRIWQIEGPSIQQHQQFEFKNADHPDAFRHLLGDLLEALKLLAVIGHVENADLSPHYLHNLFQTTLDLALPALVNTYRSQRAEVDANTAEDADQLATEANRLLLLQLLGLAWHQQLPSAILPEKLQRAIQLSLPQLPEVLRDTLSLKPTATPPELPLDAAVCFHHLLLRLRQLSWKEPEQRAITGMLLLIEHWNDYPGQKDDAEVLLYPQGPVFGSQAQLILSGSPSLLAAARLREDLLQQPATELHLGTLFQLNLSGKTDLSIRGTLNNQRLLARDERHHYAMLLRTSWPHRRFRIGGEKPLWFWELIHLLGLSKDQQKISLTLPRALLKSPPTDVFWELLVDSYAICTVTALANEMIDLTLIPKPNRDGSIQVILDGETRVIPRTNDVARLRNQLLLTLELPAAIYPLLDDKLIWIENAEPEPEIGTAIKLYINSGLCRLYEQILDIDLLSADTKDLQTLLKSIPLPDQFLQQEIEHCSEAATQDQLPDQILATTLQVPEISKINTTTLSPTRTTVGDKGPNKELQEELIQELLTTGIPTFPEQYLYFLEEPEIISYQLTAPLIIKSELLGEIELEDATGKKFRVYGEELANALLLCSQLGKSCVDLPKDRNQLALLQKQYWKDLKQLHKNLNSLCYSRLQSPKAANKLVKKIWKKLNLPKVS